MISLKIDVTKISKAKLYTGQKGTYLSCVLIETPNAEYGDYVIIEETTKEERSNGVKGTILGNAKKVVFEKKEEKKDEINISDVPNRVDKSDLPF